MMTSSATGVRAQEASAGTGAPFCSAVIAAGEDAGGAPFLIPCPNEADGWHQGRCPCGHVRDGWLCTVHGTLADAGGCRACLESLDPHDCPLPVSRVTPGGAP